LDFGRLTVPLGFSVYTPATALSLSNPGATGFGFRARGQSTVKPACARISMMAKNGGNMNSAHIRRVIAAGIIGNVLEWYDFAIYGYFAATIGRQFFPREDTVTQLLSAFGVFAIGYLMRPLGGVLVGHIGDTFGRRAALIFSVVAMAIPTFLMGLLPGYQTIGVLAPIGLTLLRVVRGAFL
jgi:predicted MFS family arabinose efflux permease